MRWIVVLGLLLSVHTAFAAEGTIQFAPSRVTSNVQENFEVVIVANTDGESIAAAEGDIVYDPAQIEVVSVSTSGSVLSMWATEPGVTKPGTVQFSGWANAPLSGTSLRLVSIIFRARNSGTQDVRLESGALLTQGGSSTNIVSTLGTLTIDASVPQTADGGQVLGVQTSTFEAPHAPRLTEPEAFVEGDRLVVRGTGDPRARVVVTIISPSGERTERVQTDADGAFVYVSEWRLGSGTHTIRAETYSEGGTVSPRAETHIIVPSRGSAALLAAVFLGAPSYVTLLVGIFSFLVGFLLYQILARTIFRKQ